MTKKFNTLDYRKPKSKINLHVGTRKDSEFMHRGNER